MDLLINMMESLVSFKLTYEYFTEQRLQPKSMRIILHFSRLQFVNINDLTSLKVQIFASPMELESK